MEEEIQKSPNFTVSAAGVCASLDCASVLLHMFNSAGGPVFALRPRSARGRPVHRHVSALLMDGAASLTRPSASAPLPASLTLSSPAPTMERILKGSPDFTERVRRVPLM
ncbi:hypothetical protein PBY51_001415 [Eleginops maclovinus]|uniref:Uncharacterized protein n=1 Tax=Eleginops maclovinus TaxID=56733 RepID=A0AAN7WXU8_ELEMC|nr:hypothetical protein PBY51_001415 [Eleginops maclovinus]